VKIFLDTNIIVRSTNRTDALHESVAEHLYRLSDAGAEFCIAPQTIYEFWTVATRPVDRNGLGRDPADARRDIESIRKAYTLLMDPPYLLDRWLDLCSNYGIRGKPSHDARLVVFMFAHEIRRLLTLNPGDFARFAEIECLVPELDRQAASEDDEGT